MLDTRSSPKKKMLDTRTYIEIQYERSSNDDYEVWSIYLQKDYFALNLYISKADKKKKLIT